MNEKLNKRIKSLEDRLYKLEDANIIYGKKIIDPACFAGYWRKSAKISKIVEKLLDHLGVTFSTNPAIGASVVIVDKKTESDKKE